jgi:hypothetical protein
MSVAPPTGFGTSLPTPDFSSTLSKGPLGDLPYTGPAVCTPDDPTGKNHTPAPGTQSNGTKGRVFTEEVRANNMTPAELAKSQRDFEYERMCQDGIMGAIACDRPIFDFQSAEFSGQAFGWGTGVKFDENGKPDWNGLNKGNSKKPTLRGGLCVKLKGAPKTDHSLKVYGAAGFVYGSVDPLSESLCVGGQFPPGLDAGLSAK